MKSSSGKLYYIVFSILLIFGLVFIIPVAYTKGEQSLYNIIFSNLSGTLIVGATLSILFKIFKDKEDLRELHMKMMETIAEDIEDVAEPGPGEKLLIQITY